MKLLVLVLLAAAAVGAELPRPYFGRLVPVQFQKLEAAPYPASAFQPAQEFSLPERQQQVPQTAHRPQQEYATPEPATEDEPTTTGTAPKPPRPYFGRLVPVQFQKTETAPYPAPGFYPAQEFGMPERQQQVPQTAHRPQEEYGPPEPTTEAEPTTTETATLLPHPYFGRRLPAQFEKLEVSPYPASGYRPAQEFRLPERQQQVPQTVYRPQQEYGPPEPTTEAEPTTTETAATDGGDVKMQTGELNEDKEELTEDLDQGVYYIYHPSGLLQRIVYATKNDLKNMAYSAQLKYENVAPISDPIYTYDPETFVLQQVVT